jgi:hypothetical protein
MQFLAAVNDPTITPESMITEVLFKKNLAKRSFHRRIIGLFFAPQAVEETEPLFRILPDLGLVEPDAP